MADFKGGRLELSINGDVFSTAAKASIDTAGVSIDNGANQDGTMRSTVAPKLVMIDITFDRGAKTRKWDTAMMLAELSVIFAETDAGVTHALSLARWQGTPTLDTASGEITGCKICCSPNTYNQLSV